GVNSQPIVSGRGPHRPAWNKMDFSLDTKSAVLHYSYVLMKAFTGMAEPSDSRSGSQMSLWHTRSASPEFGHGRCTLWRHCGTDISCWPQPNAHYSQGLTTLVLPQGKL